MPEILGKSYPRGWNLAWDLVWTFPQWGKPCLRFSSYFTPVGIICLKSGSYFTPVG